MLKIVKKHDKFSIKPMRKEILQVLKNQPFYKALKTSNLFTQTERFLKEFVNATEKQCTICIESCVTPVRLACGHEFCWECLALAMLSDIKTCPLCRSEQSLNPVDLNITAILGAVDAHKYFPSNVDPSEVRKRTVDSVRNCSAAQKRMKCGHSFSRAVDLTSWLEKKIENISDNFLIKVETSPSKSPFACEGEIHIEMNSQSTAPLANAIVLVRRNECLPEEGLTTKSTNPETQPSNSSLVMDASDRNARRNEYSALNVTAGSIPRAGVSPSHPKSFEDWFNDVLVDELDVKDLSHSHPTIDAIKV